MEQSDEISTRKQTEFISDTLKQISRMSHIKKDEKKVDLIEGATSQLDYIFQPSISLLCEFMKDTKKKVKVLAISCFLNLLDIKSFYFSKNDIPEFIKALFHAFEEPRSPCFDLAYQCLEKFIKSYNTVLYLHDDQLQLLMSSLLNVLLLFTNDRRVNLSRIVVNIVQYVKENISGDKTIEDYAIPDYYIVIKQLIHFLQSSHPPDVHTLVIGTVNKLVFPPPSHVSDHELYNRILLLEIPQLFITVGFTTREYAQIKGMFKEYCGFGDRVFCAIPAIISQLITPAFESNVNVDKAYQFINEISTMERNVFLSVFAKFDCSSQVSERIFEKMLSGMCMHCKRTSDTALLRIKSMFIILNSIKSSLKNAGARGTDNIDEKKIIQKKITMEEAAKIFNTDPSKEDSVISSFVSSELVEQDDFKIGQFLRTVDLLDLNRVSEFLCHRKRLEMCRGYISTFDFKGMEIDQALRAFVLEFNLSGEGQVIDKIVTEFGKKYYEDNKTLSADDASVISFSIVMLNTSLFNSNVKNRMTKEQWIKNTLSANCNISTSQLEEIYQRIANNPLKMKNGYGSTDFDEINKIKNQELLGKLVLSSQNEENPTIILEHIILSVEIFYTHISPVLSESINALYNPETVVNSMNCCIKLVYLLSHCDSVLSKRNEIIKMIADYVKDTPSRESKSYGVQALVYIANEAAKFNDEWIPILELFSQMHTLYSNNLHISQPDSLDGSLASVYKDKESSIMSVYESPDRLGAIDYQSFITNLCKVSTSTYEIYAEKPSTFTLGKIIEILKKETSSKRREKPLWKQVWTIASGQFERASSVPHIETLKFSTDGLRDIILCAAETDLWDSFQIPLLKPLVTIYSIHSSEEGREYIVESFDSITKKVKITEGWVILLELFIHATLNETSNKLLHMLWNILKENYLNLPEDVLEKYLQPIMWYSYQEHLEDLNVESIKISGEMALKLVPTLELASLFKSCLTSENSDVVEVASEAYFSVLVNYENTNEHSDEISERILSSLDAIKNNTEVAMNSIIRSIFNIFIPKCKNEDTSRSFIKAIVGKISSDCPPSTFHIIFSGLVNIAEKYTDVCEEMLKKLLSMENCTMDELNYAYDNKEKLINAPDVFYTIALISLTMTSSDYYPKILKHIFDIYKDGKIKSEHVVDIVISGMNALVSSTDYEKVIRCITIIKDELIEHGFSPFKNDVFQLQNSLYKFYAVESLQVRKEIQQIAVNSLILLKRE